MREGLRLAVAQSTVPEDPTDSANLRASGTEIRRLMREASAAGARLVQFPEGAITYPGKHAMSSGPPGPLAAADWSRVDRSVMRGQAQSVADLAGELELWVVFGSLHPLTPPHRPHNSLYVVSDEGALVARYDKRYLSVARRPAGIRSYRCGAVRGGPQGPPHPSARSRRRRTRAPAPLRSQRRTGSVAGGLSRPSTGADPTPGTPAQLTA
ncbi:MULTISPECIES: nitrilase-related carbon-nitrogen hydrolase [Streptomyces]|uniref:nitrilase-related carbon-nitrogen hydrolase n=1 Tax=Streptomyces TaxID=1883 RepID=UPI000A87A901|nr:nitrilase-related carbon-nitrogen hydrolase [Streptomyces sp. NRRL WC-3725]